MKTRSGVTCGISALAVLAMSAMAFVTMEFPGWRALEQQSRDIFVAQCATTPSPNAEGEDAVSRNMRGLVDSEIRIVAPLKGATNSGIVQLRSQYWPRQGEHYLVFATFSFGSYQAFEPYRIVPLGLSFDANSLEGKPLPDQIRMLLRERLSDLNRQMQADQQEKSRLEEATGVDSSSHNVDGL